MSKAATENNGVAIRRVGKWMEMRMNSDPAALRPARLGLEESCLAWGISVEDTEKIGLVLNEALANVIRHGYGGVHDKPIVVTYGMEGEAPSAKFSLRIRDWGKPVDPASLPWNKQGEEPPDVEKVKPGGLGLLCMKKMMDEVIFAPQSDGTLLTLVKKIGTLEHKHA